MDAQRRAEITEWDAREFSDGFSGLRAFADRGFSGAVTDGAGWLFLYDGRVVGAVETTLEAFAEASGTAYEAPHESLPVLFAMQAAGGEPRAQYYTNDTPLSQADQKLSQGGFTGYIELSENVLSGDYYVAYTAGESMPVAFVGNARRLETGDEAFSLADDEVGIYTVYEADITVREIPSETSDDAEESDGSAENDVTDEEPDTDAAEDQAVEGAERHSDTGTDTTNATNSRSDTTSSGDEATDTAESSATTVEHDGTPSDATERSDSGDDPTAADTSTPAERSDSTPTQPARQSGQSAKQPGQQPGPDGQHEPESGARASQSTSPRSSGNDEQQSQTRPAEENGQSVADSADDVFSEEAEWREQKSIPALDPAAAGDPEDERNAPDRNRHSGGGDAASSSGATTATQHGTRQSTDPQRSINTHQPTETRQGADAQQRGDENTTERSEPAPRTPRESTTSDGTTSDGTAASTAGTDRVEQLESALEAATAERDSLAAERDTVVSERDELAAKNEELTAEIEQLERDIDSLREERNRLREELSTAQERLPKTDRTISATEARQGTNLFIRYDSKGGATLEDAHNGSVERDALRENLKIEHHTSFETDGLAVDGRPFGEFLHDTIEFGFTRWLVEDLPFEVSETGNQSTLRDLYDALPRVDRAEIDGAVSIIMMEDGEETREQRNFDLVLRDRMGNPLFVAELNDSRDPTAEGTLESLVSSGRDIAESNDSFAAAFAVTESFFEPGALETASDAVGGGLFSRSKRSSFVKLSRKQGYHLCLVEARDGGFHMTLPDL